MEQKPERERKARGGAALAPGAKPFLVVIF